jgi:cyclomaltodextrinase
MMLLEAIYHRPKSNYAYAYNEETLHIRVRTKRDDMDQVYLLHCDKYNLHETGFTKVEMSKLASDTLFDYYQAEVTPEYRRCAYLFEFISGEEKISMNEVGFVEKTVDDTTILFATGLFEYPFLNAIDVMKPPQWVKDAVFYQIFPERFGNGDPNNDPKDVELWDEAEPTRNNFFGGDLQGVIDHLDHLVELGINAIYFTPIFEAFSNHKYDTIDYLTVDPQFGDSKLARKLVKKCHEKGIKVMLDAVFNHSGYFFAPFQDVLKNGEKSEFKDWFYIREYPVVTDPKANYDTFAFVPEMPKLNTEHPLVKEYLLEVARYWIADIGCDGWRFDVVNEVDHQFWREFRQVVKSANPEAYILGEIWHNSLPWLQGDQFDAIMNYPVTTSVLEFFCKDIIDAEEFMGRLDAIMLAYPLQVNEASFNLLDSHDTARLLTISKDNKKRMKLAATFQLTYLGAPCIYYGDEIGMTGDNDPDCRKPMVWHKTKQDLELFEFYKSMIKLRLENRALRDGTFRFLTAEKKSKLVAYERTTENTRFIIAMNSSEEAAAIQIPGASDSSWHVVSGSGVITTKANTLKVTLPALEYVIIKG